MNVIKPAIIAMACALLISACGEAPGEATAPVLRPVKFLTIGANEAAGSRIYPGVVRAAESAEVGFEVPGRVVSLEALEGQRVEAGEALARLDPSDYQSQLEIALANLRKAQADLARSENIQSEDAGAITAERIDGDRRAVEVAQARADQARKAVEDTVLRAPFEGVVSQRLIDEFENVRAKQPVMIVENLDNMEVSVNVPERDVVDRRNNGMQGFDEAQLARLTTEINPRVSLSARPDDIYPARFTEISTRADAATRTFAVRMTLDVPAGVVLLPGMTARVTGDFRSADEAVYIPLTALASAPNGSGRVWVIDTGRNVVSARDVALGELMDDQVLVTTGLAPGETIAATGANLLVEGMQVKRFE